MGWTAGPVNYSGPEGILDVRVMATQDAIDNGRLVAAQHRLESVQGEARLCQRRGTTYLVTRYRQGDGLVLTLSAMAEQGEEVRAVYVVRAGSEEVLERIETEFLC
jgi:hypothetical protein